MYTVVEIQLTEEDYRLSPEDDGVITVIVQVITSIATPMFLRLTPFNFTYIRNEINEGRLNLVSGIRDEIQALEDERRPSEATSEI